MIITKKTRAKISQVLSPGLRKAIVILGNFKAKEAPKTAEVFYLITTLEVLLKKLNIKDNFWN